MNNHLHPAIRQALAPFARNYPWTTVNPYGFDMDVQYDFEPGEPAILWGDNAHPGCGASAEILAVHVNGVDIYQMLSDRQLTRIEEAVLRNLED